MFKVLGFFNVVYLKKAHKPFERLRGHLFFSPFRVVSNNFIAEVDGFQLVLNKFPFCFS